MNTGIFAIHKHETEKLHYDLRIEIAGELHCWALTKGISTDTGTRRMGIKIENQSLDLAEFEGEIDEERYGSAQAILWDKGTYRNIRAENGDDMNMVESLNDGHLKMFFEGEKLTGGFTLIDVHYGKTKWLQIKEKDEYVDEKNDIMTRKPDSISS